MKSSALLSLFVLSLLSSACSGSRLRYELPPPPPLEEQRTVELDPSEAARDEGQRFIEARATILGFFDALNSGNTDAALDFLSQETRLLLEAWSDGDANVALSSGRLQQDAEVYDFDPASLFVVAQPTRFDDDVAGEVDSETARRKEVHVTGADGEQRRVVLILEGDQWRIHQPRLPTERLSPVQ
jgi:hypothetical protein